MNSVREELTAQELIRNGLHQGCVLTGERAEDIGLYGVRGAAAPDIGKVVLIPIRCNE